MAFLDSDFTLSPGPQLSNSDSKAFLLCSSYTVHSSLFYPWLNQKSVKCLPLVQSPAAEILTSSGITLLITGQIQNFVRFSSSFSKLKSMNRQFHKQCGSRDGKDGRLVHHFLPVWNISTIGWLVMKFCTDIDGPQRMKPSDFGDLFTFPL